MAVGALVAIALGRDESHKWSKRGIDRRYMNVETEVGAREESIVSYCVRVGSDRQCLARLRSQSSGRGPEQEVEETEKHWPMPLVLSTG